tara:strand:- start:366 stop:560 length:195 start_codon:yes stop_codon:yes gene_type:complete
LNGSDGLSVIGFSSIVIEKSLVVTVISVGSELSLSFEQEINMKIENKVRMKFDYVEIFSSLFKC